MARTTHPQRHASATSPAWTARAGFALGIALFAGLGLRLLGLQSDFWFDEVWSARYSLEAASVAEVYAHKLDNNHLLNSLAIHFLGPSGSVLPYRALAFVSGLIVLGLATAGLSPRRPTVCLVRATLIGASPLVVLLSTEARGYAPALAACLIGHQALRRALDANDPRAVLLFNAVMPLGLLSHLVFLHFYLAAFVFAAVRLLRRRTGTAEMVRRWLTLFAFPTAVALAHFVAFVSDMETGGGPRYTLGGFSSRLLAHTFGLPAWGPLLVLAGGLAAWGFATELRSLQRKGDDDWVFLLVIVVLSPIFFLGVFPTSVIAVRYFSIQVLFLLLTLAKPIARGIERGGAARALAGLALFTLLAGNALYHADFARAGRGQYRAALETIAAATPTGRAITIGGDHDSRVRLLVEFHSRFIARDVRYVRQEEIAASPPEWFIAHDTRAPQGPAAPRIAVHGHRYRNVERFPFAYLSGFTWDVYRLDRPGQRDER